jgi:hypothetical protein
LYSEVHALLKGASACDGTAFRVTVDANGRAIVRLCQPVFSPGVLADARFAAEVRATLRQFSTVREIRILTHDGHCFGDESGRDQCLSSP